MTTEFLNNKYTKWYYSIIKKALHLNRIKSKDSYFERHHIIPKCCGGTNEKDNLVLLTYKEHFLCHWLLIKMVDDKEIQRKLQFAISRMSKAPQMVNKVVTSWQYALMRKSVAMAMSRRPISAHFSKRMSEIHTGKIITDEHKQKWRETVKRNNTDLGAKCRGKIRPPNLKKMHSEFMNEYWSDADKVLLHKENLRKSVAIQHKRKIGMKLYNNGFTQKYFKDIPSDKSWILGSIRKKI